jgi:peptidoglycan hydrolase-like protein with peptidoglycan-binding domain
MATFQDGGMNSANYAKTLQAKFNTGTTGDKMQVAAQVMPNYQRSLPQITPKAPIGQNPQMHALTVQPQVNPGMVHALNTQQPQMHALTTPTSTVQTFDTPKYSSTIPTTQQVVANGPVASAQPMVRVGSNGDSVKLLQQKLGITADGIFGPQTQAAVRNYQASHGLSVDGIVGQQTWGALLGNAGSGQQAATPTQATPASNDPYALPTLDNLGNQAENYAKGIYDAAKNQANQQIDFYKSKIDQLMSDSQISDKVKNDMALKYASAITDLQTGVNEAKRNYDLAASQAQNEYTKNLGSLKNDATQQEANNLENMAARGLYNSTILDNVRQNIQKNYGQNQTSLMNQLAQTNATNNTNWLNAQDKYNLGLSNLDFQRGIESQQETNDLTTSRNNSRSDYEQQLNNQTSNLNQAYADYIRNKDSKYQDLLEQLRKDKLNLDQFGLDKSKLEYQKQNDAANRQHDIDMQNLKYQLEAKLAASKPSYSGGYSSYSPSSSTKSTNSTTSASGAQNANKLALGQGPITDKYADKIAGYNQTPTFEQQMFNRLNPGKLPSQQFSSYQQYMNDRKF